MDLIADIGATLSRCALLDHEGAILAPETFNNSEFDGVEPMLQAYIARRRESSNRLKTPPVYYRPWSTS